MQGKITREEVRCERKRDGDREIRRKGVRE